MANSLGYVYDDGGRSKYYKAKGVRDCVVRAWAIATDTDYKEMYNLFKSVAGETPRNGVAKPVIRRVGVKLGWKWIPTMKIGSGCKYHLNADDLSFVKDKTIIAHTARHCVAVVNGVVHDIWDSRMENNRCVYGYWEKIQV